MSSENEKLMWNLLSSGTRGQVIRATGGGTLSTWIGLSTTFTWDPGNLADGAGETKSVTVTGAALGDFVLIAPPYDLQDMLLTAYVQATNTVEVRLQNESGGAINLASGTWKVVVFPFI